MVPHQQFAYTKGKNSSDIALVIDAMDLLHSGRFDGFVLVSSDSDFTRLASRVREQGLDVFGIGRQKTPESFRKACKRFIFIENLLAATGSAVAADGEAAAADREPTQAQPAAADEEPGEPTQGSGTGDVPAGGALRQPPSKAVPMIVAAMRNHDEDWVPLSVVGSHLHETNPEFDSRTYGCTKLTDLLEKTGQFEVRRDTVPAVAPVKRLR